MESLRMAFLTDMCSPLFGGGYQARHWNLAKHLVRRGHSVVIYTAQPSPVSTVEGVQFRRVAPPVFLKDTTGSRTLSFSAVYAVGSLKEPAWAERPDSLVTEAIPYVHLPAVGRWAHRRGATCLLSVNEAWTRYAYLAPPLDGLSRTVVSTCLRQGIRWNDAVMAISEVTARSLRENYRAPRVRVVPMGLDVEPFLRDLAASAPAGPFDVVSIGRLVAIKRHRDLLEALGRMRTEFGWTGRAAIVGGGGLMRTLERQRSALGLSDQVVLTGTVSEAEKLRILAGARAFALCSEREGFSLATLEAALGGAVPIVAVPPEREVFGASDLVHDGVDGLHYPLGDTGALASRIHMVLSDPQLAVRLSRAAREGAERYDWSRIASGLEALARDPGGPDATTPQHLLPGLGPVEGPGAA